MRILKPLNEFFSIIVIFCFLIETSLANEHQTIEFWNEIKKADSLNSAKEENATLVIVTHDQRLKKLFNRIIEI